MGSEPLRATLKRFIVVAAFGVAFAYVEAAVVVYLRAIFHPGGFSLPLTVFSADALGERILLTEAGREVATIVIIFASSWLFGRVRQERFAYFLTIFAVWDIFYYVWLKVLIDWPGSIMDWDILFLIPAVWAGPVLAPVLVSLVLLAFAVIILYRDSRGGVVRVSFVDWVGFILAGVVVVGSFCIAGGHITEPDFGSYFYWSLFAAGLLLAAGVFVKCLLRAQ